MRRLFGGLILMMLGGHAQAQQVPFCQEMTFQQRPYSVCEVNPEISDLRLFLNDPDGRPLGHFSRLSKELERQGETLLFAMNGGMYHPDRSPVGLYVENGKQIMHVVEGAGPGNFGMVPNGVFCIEKNRARVIETEAYVKDQPTCDFATQSGPMLVVDGELHPRFFPESDSRHIRNGVGTSPDGKRVFFVKSDGLVNFFEFASLFRDRLNTPFALYLDGNISRLFDQGAGRDDKGFRMGPIIGVVGRAN